MVNYVEETKEPVKTIEFWLEQRSNGEVGLKAERIGTSCEATGWSIFTLTPEGKLKMHSHIGGDLGFATDERKRMKVYL